MTEKTRRLLYIALSAVIGSALVIVAATRVDWQSVGGELAQAKLVPLLVAFVFYAGIVVLWAAQWRSLLPRQMRIPYSKMFEIVAVMAMVANTVPYMVGQGTGAFLLSTRGKVGHAAAVGVLALEQLAEGFSKLGLLLVAALLIPLPGWLMGGMVGITVSILALVTVFIVAVAWHRITPVSHQEAERQSRFRRFLGRLAGHLDAVRDWRVFGLGLLCTIGMKVTEGIGIAFIQYAFGVEPSLGGVVLVLVATNTATMVSLVPGNLGVYEGAAYLAYSFIGVPAEQAVGMSVVHHFYTLAAMVGTGYLVVVTRSVRVPWGRRALSREHEA